ncbi:MAG: LapA family protein [Thermodesulfobacteriota bacterium]
MKHVKAIVSILIMLLVIIVIVENLEQLSKTVTLRVDLLVWSHETPPMAFYLVMIMVFLLGVFIAGFLGIVERFRLKKEIKVLSREKDAKDREINSLKSVPVYEGGKVNSVTRQEDEIVS